MDAEVVAAPTPVHLTPADCVLIPLAAACIGTTAKAIERKIERGMFPEGAVWFRAPDGRIYIDLKAHAKWVRGELKRGA